MTASTPLTASTLGWDIGGANLKAVRLDGTGAVAVRERAFPLWREPAGLPAALDEMARSLGPASRMAVTMTAELADCFASKREGVTFVLDALRAAFPTGELRIWGADGRFRSVAHARRQPHIVAAANWSATAHLVARLRTSALLVDVGSTTTDIIPIVDGHVAARGRTDPERLRTGELVYTGALRTPICAIVPRVPLEAGWHRIAAETFAIAADVHLWLGRIGPEAYTCETPDGRGLSRDEVAARIARVVCADPDMLAPEDLDRVAHHVARAQRRRITGAIREVVRRFGSAAPSTAVIAGSGAFLGRRAARAAGLETTELDREVGREIGSSIGHAAAAAAVAWLLAAT